MTELFRAAPGGRNSPSALPASPRSRSTADELARLRSLVATCSHLSASAAAPQTELGTVASFLAEQTGCVVAVLDRGVDVLAVSGGADPDENDEELAAQVRGLAADVARHGVLAAVTRNRRAVTVPRPSGETVVIAPVSTGEDVVGFLLTVGDGASMGPTAGMGEDMLLLASEHAAMVCGVLLGRDLVVAAASGRARRELFEGLLLAGADDLAESERWARRLGFDPSREYAVVAVEVVPDATAAPPPAVQRLFARLVPDGLVADRADEVVVVVPAAPGAEAAQTAYELVTRGVRDLRGRGLTVGAVGVGDSYTGAAHLARSYAEARRALAAARHRDDPDTITRFAELGIHRLLLRFPDTHELRTFATEVLGDLLTEHTTTGMDYLTTLAIYFEENNSPSRAAQRLYVHPNTVSYRIRRIEDITGLHLDRHRDRLMAAVAVEITRTLQERS